MLSWFARSPLEFGYTTELWTGKRVVDLIRKHFKVKLDPSYILTWLARRRITSQNSRSVPRERDDAVIEQWFKHDWPRLLKKRVH